MRYLLEKLYVLSLKNSGMEYVLIGYHGNFGINFWNFCDDDHEGTNTNTVSS